MAAHFPEPKFAVPRIVAEGLTVFAGAPKAGKSWLALNLAVAVASGGKALGQIPVQQGQVLFLALEDPPRRLKERLEMVLGSDPAPDDLRIETWWVPVVDGGADDLQAWLTAHPGTRLVIVDVFSQLRSPTSLQADRYLSDYMAIEPLKKLADDHEVAILLNHHTRKQGADDFLDTISGTQGLAGAADSVLVLQRSRGRADAELLVTGRDIGEASYALKFSAEVGTWGLLGDAAEWALSDERHRIIRVLRSFAHPLSPKEITDELGASHDAIRQNLHRMAKAEQVVSNGDGTYSLKAFSTPVTPGTPVTAEGISVTEVTTVTPLESPDQDETALRLVRDTFPSAEVVEEIPREENDQ